MSGLKETFIKRYTVERTNKAEIRSEEQSEKARVVGRIYEMKYSWKGHKDRHKQEQNTKEWASSLGLCQKHKSQHPHRGDRNNNKKKKKQEMGKNHKRGRRADRKTARHYRSIQTDRQADRRTDNFIAPDRCADSTAWLSVWISQTITSNRPIVIRKTRQGTNRLRFSFAETGIKGS